MSFNITKKMEELLTFIQSHADLEVEDEFETQLSRCNCLCVHIEVQLLPIVMGMGMRTMPELSMRPIGFECSFVHWFLCFPKFH